MDNVIEAIRTLLDTADTENIYNKIYYGENKIPPQQFFPFIEVIPNNTSVVNKTTCGGIESSFDITINIKDTVKNFVTSDRNKEVVEGMKEMIKRMEERDGTGMPKSTTILGVLLDNLKLNNSVHINDEWNISYDETEYNGSWILIASISFTAYYLTP